MLTKEDIERAQQAWGEGIVSISAAHSSGADYIQRAITHIESLYAYGISPVLFKPTFASENNFVQLLKELYLISLEIMIHFQKIKDLLSKVGQEYDLKIKTS